MSRGALGVGRFGRSPNTGYVINQYYLDTDLLDHRAFNGEKMDAWRAMIKISS